MGARGPPRGHCLGLGLSQPREECAPATPKNLCDPGFQAGRSAGTVRLWPEMPGGLAWACEPPRTPPLSGPSPQLVRSHCDDRTPFSEALQGTWREAGVSLTGPGNGSARPGQVGRSRTGTERGGPGAAFIGVGGGTHPLMVDLKHKSENSKLKKRKKLKWPKWSVVKINQEHRGPGGGGAGSPSDSGAAAACSRVLV